MNTAPPSPVPHSWFDLNDTSSDEDDGHDSQAAAIDHYVDTILAVIVNMHIDQALMFVAADAMEGCNNCQVLGPPAKRHRLAVGGNRGDDSVGGDADVEDDGPGA